jgi:cytoskeletal protein CcmA (bactofilin family)
MWTRNLRGESVRGDEEGAVAKQMTSPAHQDAHPSPGAASHARIGRSIYIKGELSGQEDLTIDGTVEGAIELQDHDLTIERHAQIKAKIRAKNVTILGEVVGEIEALERVAIQAEGYVQGNVLAPRVMIADGARFQGSIEMPDAAPPGASEPRRDAGVEAGRDEALLATRSGEETTPWGLDHDIPATPPPR